MVWGRPYRPIEYRERKSRAQIVPTPKPGEPATFQVGGFLWAKAHLEAGPYRAWRSTWPPGRIVAKRPPGFVIRKSFKGAWQPWDPTWSPGLIVAKRPSGFVIRKSFKGAWQPWDPTFEDVLAEDWKVGEK